MCWWDRFRHLLLSHSGPSVSLDLGSCGLACTSRGWTRRFACRTAACRKWLSEANFFAGRDHLSGCYSVSFLSLFFESLPWCYLIPIAYHCCLCPAWPHPIHRITHYPSLNALALLHPRVSSASSLSLSSNASYLVFLLPVIASFDHEHV
jgi:hypothetical protein